MKIVIPFKTPTVNHMYFTWNNRRILTKEAKEIRKDIDSLLQKDTCGIYDLQNNKLKVTVKIYEDWNCKDGSVKKKDLLNREKFLIDSIFSSLGLDDKFIFEHKMIKVQSKEEKSIVIIEVLD